MECPFCYLADKNYSEVDTARRIYGNSNCYALLEAEQSVCGYTLVIPKAHHETLFATDIGDFELEKFWRTVQRIGRAIMKTVGCENIYVVSMCDGVRHFHVHLTPRYKWTDADKQRYRELFTERDGEQSINACIEKGTIGGNWYLADAERNYTKTEFMKMPLDKRIIRLKQLAEDIKRNI